MNQPKLTSRVALRLAVGLVAFLALGGPSPGHIGNCSGVSSGTPDANQYCVEKAAQECRRDFMAGRTDAAAFDTCVNSIYPMCDSVITWVGCVPTSAQTRACLNILSDTTRDAIPLRDIPECQMANWCPAGI